MNGKLRNMASVYILCKDSILMLYRIGSKVVAPSWCGIGGHFECNELNDARACMLRELNEEMRLMESDLKNVELRYITLRLKNGEVRQNYYFFADLKENIAVSLACDEGKPEWIPIKKLEGLEMPFTSKYVLEHYLKIGRFTNRLYGGNAVEDGVLFAELNEF